MPDTGALHTLRTSFQNGTLRSCRQRVEQLQSLKRSILAHEQEINDALYTDLKKSKEEVWVTETGMVISELSVAIKNLRKWMEPEYVPTNLLNLPSSSSIWSEPKGVVLIIAPWNYPFNLLFIPLIGAIAAGNTVVLKPSEFARTTEQVMGKIIADAFSPELVLYRAGDGAKVIPEMMNNFSFDHVFYTGSTEVGRLIYKMAAEKLVPVTLELGGKSPCVVDGDANIKVAARRIAMTKFSNAGQMCVAPDYLLIHQKVKDEFVKEIKKAIEKFFTGKAEESDNYGRIINEKQFDRISNYLSSGKVILGGRSDKKSLFFEPTLIEDLKPGSNLMKEEIFGPILPVIPFSTRQEALTIISNNPNPLAFYIYSGNKKIAEQWVASVPAGGCCINNSSWHLTNHNLPFGGRGFSGTGSYHGKFSFDTFSHKKAVMKTPTWFDPAIKYPPFKGKLGLFKKIIR